MSSKTNYKYFAILLLHEGCLRLISVQRNSSHSKHLKTVKQKLNFNARPNYQQSKVSNSTVTGKENQNTGEKENMAANVHPGNISPYIPGDPEIEFFKSSR